MQPTRGNHGVFAIVLAMAVLALALGVVPLTPAHSSSSVSEEPQLSTEGAPVAVTPAENPELWYGVRANLHVRGYYKRIDQILMWPSGDKVLVVLTGPRGRDVETVPMVHGEHGWVIPSSCPCGERAQFPCVTSPWRVSGKKPKYPKRARREGIGGYVILRYSILEDGTTADPLLITCSAPGFGLEAAAARALETWRYIPAKRRGVAVRCCMTAVFEFEFLR